MDPLKEHVPYFVHGQVGWSFQGESERTAAFERRRPGSWTLLLGGAPTGEGAGATLRWEQQEIVEIAGLDYPIILPLCHWSFIDHLLRIDIPLIIPSLTIILISIDHGNCHRELMVNDGKIRGANHREVMVDDDKMMINNARCPPPR